MASALVLQALDNVTLLERPAPMRTVISAVQAALRERRRQYQIREQMEEIRRLLEVAQTARAEAEHASRLKDEFLATVSHELRTPLSAMLLWSRMLAMGKVTEADRADAIGAIIRSAEAQRQLIEDLLDMARIMSGKLRLNLREMDLAQSVRAAVDAVRPVAAVKRVSLDVQFNPCEGMVLGDPERLQQVVWNLLTNAVKFTPEGGRVEIRLCPHDGGMARIIIKDTGKGIAPQFLPYVFERFRQGDASTTRTHGGLGLGLAIVRELVELHGGAVSVDSEGDAKGATFTVELPLVTGSRRATPTPPTSTVPAQMCRSLPNG
jgi:signal transduction histidine kinase